jgi:hypothetical protein
MNILKNQAQLGPPGLSRIRLKRFAASKKVR